MLSLLLNTNSYDADHLLPKTGMLYFFYSADQEVWGFDIKDKNKFKVLYYDPNKMLGYADTIQSEMELECELVTNGLYCGDPSGYNDPRAKES